jgi:hypothetical protein
MGKTTKVGTLAPEGMRWSSSRKAWVPLVRKPRPEFVCVVAKVEQPKAPQRSVFAILDDVVRVGFKVAVTCILLSFMMPAMADTIYKCTSAGKVVYSDLPCQKGIQQQDYVPLNRISVIANDTVPYVTLADKSKPSLLTKAIIPKLENEPDKSSIPVLNDPSFLEQFPKN